ncbi:MAG: hypothetical protein HYV97_06940 [Bdellovibrio sp.]|nr:hypothetical protein [Bdellovibrio sp.]
MGITWCSRPVIKIAIRIRKTWRKVLNFLVNAFEFVYLTTILTFKKIPVGLMILGLILGPLTGTAYAKGDQGVEWKSDSHEKNEKDNDKHDEHKSQNGSENKSGNKDNKDDHKHHHDDGPVGHQGDGPVLPLIRRGVVIFPNFLNPATNVLTAGETTTITGDTCLYKLQGTDGGRCQNFKKNSIKFLGSYPNALTDVTSDVQLIHKKDKISFNFTTPPLIEQDGENTFHLIVLSRALDLTSLHLYRKSSKFPAVTSR